MRDTVIESVLIFDEFNDINRLKAEFFLIGLRLSDRDHSLNKTQFDAMFDYHIKEVGGLEV